MGPSLAGYVGPLLDRLLQERGFYSFVTRTTLRRSGGTDLRRRAKLQSKLYWKGR